MRRSTWHLRAGVVVLAWLVALVAVAFVHPFVPAARWLLVHLLLLGAVSNAILVWSWHFAAALLKLPDDDMARGRVARLVVLNAGAVAVVAGMVTSTWPLTLVGGTAVGVVALWHAGGLLQRMRRALPSRFGATVRYYVAAGAVLPLGVALGVLMARGAASDRAHAQMMVAHALLNLLGWVGLTVLGTLVTLWPTMLRTRMADGSEHVARRALPGLLVALAVAAGAALAGSLLVTALGVAGYLAAVVAVCLPHLDEVRRKPPVAFGTLSVLAGLAWLVVSLAVLAVALATAPGWEAAAARADWLAAPRLAGFAAQVLLGALSYLLPVVLGGGPNAIRAQNQVLDRGGALRVTVANAGLAVCVLPAPSLVRVLCSVLVLLALASFLPLAVRSVVVSRRPPDGKVPDGVPASRRTGLAAAGLAVVVLAAAGGVAADPAALGLPGAPAAAAGVKATGHTTTVHLTVKGMRFVPGTVDVPAGDRLVIELTNTGTDTHDLVLETGARTPRLAPGAKATLDVGVVGRDLEGWCSVAGHRQMGMVLTVHATGASAEASAAEAEAAMPGMHQHAAGSRAGQAPSAANDIDLAAEPGKGFTARDATLPPAPAETTHRLTMTVQEVEREVAPGVRQKLWTFNGTAPGPVLRGKVGDTFEITLVNDGSIGHSVDFHAGSLAPDGPMRTIQPGQRLVYRFTAQRAGVWMYHCATMPMSLHIANGMFGAVVIDPPDLRPVDREYLLVQSDMYLGPQGEVADASRLATGQPDLVVFNGYADQYDHAPLQAKVGERVRIWVLAVGPNRGTAFHVVGAQFDTVYSEGAYLLPPGTAGGSQVLSLAPAQGGFVELTFPEAGHYPFVTHVMVDAEKGAHGVFEVR
ncbi:MAG: multicopper oxidase domain-containing protein [Actinomycetes bacterium]